MNSMDSWSGGGGDTSAGDFIFHFLRALIYIFLFLMLR